MIYFVVVVVVVIVVVVVVVLFCCCRDSFFLTVVLSCLPHQRNQICYRIDAYGDEYKRFLRLI